MFNDKINIRLKKTISNIRNKNIIIFSFSLLAFLLPLIYFPLLIQAFRLPKNLTLFLILFLLFGLKIKDFNYEIHVKSSLTVFIFLFYTFSLLSIFQSINKWESIYWLLFLLNFLVLYMIIIHKINHLEQIQTIIKFLIFSGFIVSFIGILQFWFGTIDLLPALKGPGSTFGNKNMGAHYISIILPFSLFFFIYYSKKYFFYGLSFALFIIYGFYCQTRSIILATLISVFLLSILFLKKLKNKNFKDSIKKLIFKKTKNKILFSILLFTLTMIILPLIIEPIGVGKYNLHKETRQVITGDYHTLNRLNIWSNTVQIIRDNPLTGIGIGNWKFIYPKYSTSAKKDIIFSIRKQPYDAHNDILQTISEIGIIGALFLLLLILTGFYMIIRTILKEKNDIKFLFYLALLWSYSVFIVISMVDFPFKHPVQSFIFWSMLAFFHVIYYKNSKQKILLQIKKKRLFSVFNLFVKIALILFFVIMIYLAIGDFYFFKGMRLWNSDNKEMGIKFMEKGSSYGFFNHRYHTMLSNVYLKIESPLKAYESASLALEFHPNNINALNNKASALGMMKKYDQAIVYFKKALSIKPDSPLLIFNLGLTYFQTRNYNKAKQQFKKLLRISPKDNRAIEFLKKIENYKNN